MNSWKKSIPIAVQPLCLVSALIALPLVLGSRHAPPLAFLRYAGVASALLVAGDWIDTRRRNFTVIAFLSDCLRRTFAMLLIGGMFFLAALVAF